jgi:hypothetical protein
MTGEPEDVPPLARIDMPGVEQQGYRAYPLVDHVADKVAATFDRYGQMEAPSTRYRDLVDLVAVAMGASVEAEPQMVALAQRPSAAGSLFRGASTYPRATSGNRAMPARRGTPCRRLPRPSTRRSPPCGFLSTRF